MESKDNQSPPEDEKMATFQHKELDGTWVKIVAPHILQMIDPNDGQSPDPADKSRYQYTVIDDDLYSRRLPPESVGDCYRGEFEPPEWERCYPPIESIITAWRDHCITHPPAVRLSWQNCRGEGYELLYVYAVAAAGPHQYWPAVTDIPCPVAGCGGTVLWYEAGYVPGYRVCMKPLANDPGAFDQDTLTHRFMAHGDAERPALILLGTEEQADNDIPARIERMQKVKEAYYQTLMKVLEREPDYEDSKEETVSLLATLLSAYLIAAEAEIRLRCLNLMGGERLAKFNELWRQKKQEDQDYDDQIELEVQWNPDAGEWLESVQSSLYCRLKVLQDRRMRKLLQCLYHAAGRKGDVWIEIDEDLVTRAKYADQSSLKKDIKTLDQAGLVEIRLGPDLLQEVKLTEDAVKLME